MTDADSHRDWLQSRRALSALLVSPGVNYDRRLPFEHSWRPARCLILLLRRPFKGSPGDDRVTCGVDAMRNTLRAQPPDLTALSGKAGELLQIGVIEKTAADCLHFEPTI